MKAYWRDCPSFRLDETALEHYGIAVGVTAMTWIFEQLGMFKSIDEVVVDPNDPNAQQYEKEHHHVDVEARYIIGGEGRFFVRSPGDKMITIEVGPGDAVVIPYDRHHCFKATTKVRAKRFFAKDSSWTPIYREHIPLEIRA